MAYSYETENFSFSSNNPKKVEIVRSWFEDHGVTIEALKANKLGHRHAMMVELTCWGYCNLTYDYWRARELKQNIKKAYVSNFKKGSIAEFWAEGVEGDEYARDKVEELTGWVI